MKKAKRILAACLTASMALSAFSACAEKQAAGSTAASGTAEAVSADEVTEVSVAIWGAEEGLAGGSQDAVLSELEKATGVRLVPQNITWDDADQKIQLWATNGQLPDIFVGDYVGKSFFFNWINQGVIRALPDDLSAYPSLKAYLEGSNRAQSAMQDGKYYMIPRRTYPDLSYSVLDRNIAYRWDLAQAAGITKEPETYDEFRAMLKAIMAADPENKSIKGMTTALPGMLPGGFFMPYEGLIENKWIYEDGRFIPSFFSKKMVGSLNLARAMYEEGTVEKDVALAKLDTVKEKFLQGQNAAIIFASGPSWLSPIAADYEKIYPGKKFLDDVKILKLLPGEDGNRYYFVDTEAWSESYISANVDDKKMAAICKLFDYLYTDEGKRLVFCGIEGVDYDLVDGAVVMREGVKLADKYSMMNPNSAVGSLAMWNPANVDRNYPGKITSEYYDLIDARVAEAKNVGTLAPFYQKISFLSTPLKDQFNQIVSDDFYQIMMGTDDVQKMYDDMVAGYKAKGLDAMIEEVNQQAKAAGINP